jgi:endonuclease YncB( thermonuclease family)
MTSNQKKHVRKVNFIDGDSGFFSDGTKFRLANVRAPEMSQYGGAKAKNVATGMITRSKGNVIVKEVARDKYGRVLVDMTNKDGSINERMRKKGYTNKGR